MRDERSLRSCDGRDRHRGEGPAGREGGRGPHGEYTGYKVSERSDRERLLIRVDAVTFRMIDSPHVLHGHASR